MTCEGRGLPWLPQGGWWEREKSPSLPLPVQPLPAAQSDLLKLHLWSCHLPCFETFNGSPGPQERIKAPLRPFQGHTRLLTCPPTPLDCPTPQAFAAAVPSAWNALSFLLHLLKPYS